MTAELAGIKEEHAQVEAALRAAQQERDRLGERAKMHDAETERLLAQSEHALGDRDIAAAQIAKLQVMLDDAKGQLIERQAHAAALATRVGELEATLAGSADVRRRLAELEERQGKAVRRLYPRSFWEGGALARWRDFVEERAHAGDAEALLLRAYLHLCAAAGVPCEEKTTGNGANGSARATGTAEEGEPEPPTAIDARKLAEALWEVSRHMYRLFARGHYNAQQSAATALEWARALMTELPPEVRIRVPTPGEPTSPQWMAFHRGQSVRGSHTWAVVSTRDGARPLPAEVDAV